jgi:hypothetical protein
MYTACPVVHLYIPVRYPSVPVIITVFEDVVYISPSYYGTELNKNDQLEKTITVPILFPKNFPWTAADLRHKQNKYPPPLVLPSVFWTRTGNVFIRIWFLLFSSMAFKLPTTKNNELVSKCFFAYFFQ